MRTRFFGSLALVGLFACGAESAPPNAPESKGSDLPPFAPVTTPASVAPDAVPLDFDGATSLDVDDFLRQLDAKTDPSTRLNDAIREDLTHADLSERTATFVSTVRRPARLALFIERTHRAVTGYVMTMSSTHQVVPPVAWLAQVVKPRGVDRAAATAWYRALAAHLASDGRASGVVLFDNGNGEEVVLDLRVDDAGDVELIARAQFFKAGSVSVDAWGPKLEGASQFSQSKMNSHRGISLSDLLSKKAQAAAPKPGVVPGAEQL